jgi:TFIIF-interacting CTD phosphatase-like protein
MGEVHIFTASTRAYADPIIDEIDPNGYITGRYFREHCKADKNGNLIKPMDIITKNLKKLIIIDDSEPVYNMYKGK